METKENKTHLSEEEIEQLVALAQEAIPPNTRLRGQGKIALTLKDRGFGPRAISRILTTHGLPVSPATVSKYLNAPHTTETSNL